MPAAFLAGGQPQAERMATLEAVRDFRLRVIVSTDLVMLRSAGRHQIACSYREGSALCKVALSVLHHLQSTLNPECNP